MTGGTLLDREVTSLQQHDSCPLLGALAALTFNFTALGIWRAHFVAGDDLAID
jgi:hypothetical protein